MRITIEGEEYALALLFIPTDKFEPTGDGKGKRWYTIGPSPKWDWVDYARFSAHHHSMVRAKRLLQNEGIALPTPPEGQ